MDSIVNTAEDMDFETESTVIATETLEDILEREISMGFLTLNDISAKLCDGFPQFVSLPLELRRLIMYLRAATCTC